MVLYFTFRDVIKGFVTVLYFTFRDDINGFVTVLYFTFRDVVNDFLTVFSRRRCIPTPPPEIIREREDGFVLDSVTTERRRTKYRDIIPKYDAGM